MLPDRVSNPGPLTYESGALPIALRGPAGTERRGMQRIHCTAIQLCEILTFYQSQGSRSDFPLILFAAFKISFF